MELRIKFTQYRKGRVMAQLSALVVRVFAFEISVIW